MLKSENGTVWIHKYQRLVLVCLFLEVILVISFFSFLHKKSHLKIESGTSRQWEHLQLLIAKEYQQTPLTCLRYKLVNGNKSWFTALFLTFPLLLLLLLWCRRQRLLKWLTYKIEIIQFLSERVFFLVTVTADNIHTFLKWYVFPSTCVMRIQHFPWIFEL